MRFVGRGEVAEDDRRRRGLGVVDVVLADAVAVEAELLEDRRLPQRVAEHVARRRPHARSPGPASSSGGGRRRTSRGHPGVGQLVQAGVGAERRGRARVSSWARTVVSSNTGISMSSLDEPALGVGEASRCARRRRWWPAPA